MFIGLCSNAYLLDWDLVVQIVNLMGLILVFQIEPSNFSISRLHFVENGIVFSDASVGQTESMLRFL